MFKKGGYNSWLEQSKEDFLKSYKLNKIKCQFEDCPLYGTCAKMPSASRLSGKAKATMFFIGEAPSSEDCSLRVPFLQGGSKLLREQFIPTLMKDNLQPYYLTYAIRDVVKGKEAPGQAYRWCGLHLRDELIANDPRVIVTLGLEAFRALITRANNLREFFPGGPQELEELTMTKIRGQMYELELFGEDSDRRVPVFPIFAPGYVLKSPAAGRIFFEDRDALKGWMKAGCQGKIEGGGQREVKVLKSQSLTTVPEVLEFFNFLTHELPPDSCVAFDTETKNLNRRWNNYFLSWQFCWDEGMGAIFPIDHPERPLFQDPKDKEKLVAAAWKLFNSTPSETNIKWFIAHNAKFDLSVMRGLLGITPRVKGCTPWWCTQLGMHWLDENRKQLSALLGGKPYSLKTLGDEFFGFKYKSSHLAARSEGELGDLPYDELVDYGVSDPVLTRALYFEELRMAERQPENAREQLERFMLRYYWPASRAVAILECNGLYVSKPHLNYLQGANSPIWGRMEEIQRELQSRPEVLAFREQHHDLLSGGETSVDYEEDLWGDSGSQPTQQIGLPALDLNKKDQQEAFYFEFLGLEAISHSEKTGNASIDKNFLDHYAATYADNPAIKELYGEFYKPNKEGVRPLNPIELDKEYRELKKLGTTYASGIQEFLDDLQGDAVDSRVRPSFWLAGTDTGRLSSSKPNFQNLPAGRTKHAKEIKNMFQAEPPSEKYPNGTALVQADYSNAEVVWSVNFSQEPELVKFLNENNEKLERAYLSDILSEVEFEGLILSTDFHKRTASLMFGVSPEKVTKLQRQAAKAITFGLLYGKSVKSLAEEQGWSYEEAEEKFAKFFSKFPKLKKWLDKQTTVAKSRGYVETMMGRRRRLDHLYRTNDKRHEGDANRRAMNSPIQGQSSDGGVIGLFLFVNYCLENDLDDRWLTCNVVHDSILVQAPFEDLEEMLPILKHCLTKKMKAYIEKYWEVKIPVLLRADFELGPKYGDLEGWDQRVSTLDKVLTGISEKSVVLWTPKEKEAKKPSPMLDLVRFKEKDSYGPI